MRAVIVHCCADVRRLLPIVYHKATPCSTFMLFELFGGWNSPRSRGRNSGLISSSVEWVFDTCSGAGSGAAGFTTGDFEKVHDEKKPDVEVGIGRLASAASVGGEVAGLGSVYALELLVP